PQPELPTSESNETLTCLGMKTHGCRQGSAAPLPRCRPVPAVQPAPSKTPDASRDVQWTAPEPAFKARVPSRHLPAEAEGEEVGAPEHALVPEGVVEADGERARVVVQAAARRQAVQLLFIIQRRLVEGEVDVVGGLVAVAAAEGKPEPAPAEAGAGPLATEREPGLVARGLVEVGEEREAVRLAGNEIVGQGHPEGGRQWEVLGPELRGLRERRNLVLTRQRLARSFAVERRPAVAQVGAEVGQHERKLDRVVVEHGVEVRA